MELMYPRFSVQNCISAGTVHTVGIEAYGFPISSEVQYDDVDYGQTDLSEEFENIIAVSAKGYHTVMLDEDGIVYECGQITKGKEGGYTIYEICDSSRWRDICAISAGINHTVGLKMTGRVVAAGDNRKGQCEVTDWKDVIAIAAGDYYTVGIKNDGTILTTLPEESVEVCKSVLSRKDLIAISAGYSCIVGLKKDGTVVASGDTSCGQCDVEDWKDIIAISAGYAHTVGLRRDGTVVATGDNEEGQCDVLCWRLKTK